MRCARAVVLRELVLLRVREHLDAILEPAQIRVGGVQIEHHARRQKLAAVEQRQRFEQRHRLQAA